MTLAEKIELGLISAVGAGFWAFAPALSSRIEVGILVMYAAALLLLQSLLRDLWLLVKSKRAAQMGPPRAAQCMCVESTVGITGIAIGAVLTSVGLGKPIVMDAWRWSVPAVLVMMIGFLIKDYVLETKPWRVRRDIDHVNILVVWKR
jgi:hypothetical protein